MNDSNWRTHSPFGGICHIVGREMNSLFFSSVLSRQPIHLCSFHVMFYIFVMYFLQLNNVYLPFLGEHQSHHLLFFILRKIKQFGLSSFVSVFQGLKWATFYCCFKLVYLKRFSVAVITAAEWKSSCINVACGLKFMYFWESNVLKLFLLHQPN